jgi:hypothetical protein
MLVLCFGFGFGFGFGFAFVLLWQRRTGWFVSGRIRNKY